MAIEGTIMQINTDLLAQDFMRLLEAAEDLKTFRDGTEYYNEAVCTIQEIKDN